MRFTNVGVFKCSVDKCSVDDDMFKCSHGAGAAEGAADGGGGGGSAGVHNKRPLNLPQGLAISLSSSLPPARLSLNQAAKWRLALWECPLQQAEIANLAGRSRRKPPNVLGRSAAATSHPSSAVLGRSTWKGDANVTRMSRRQAPGDADVTLMPRSICLQAPESTVGQPMAVCRQGINVEYSMEYSKCRALNGILGTSTVELKSKAFLSVDSGA
eukprot:1188569-Prorocentrum_minimum.AAC.1